MSNVNFEPSKKGDLPATKNLQPMTTTPPGGVLNNLFHDLKTDVKNMRSPVSSGVSNDISGLQPDKEQLIEPVPKRGPATPPLPPQPSPPEETDEKSKADKLREEADKEMEEGIRLIELALQYRQLAVSAQDKIQASEILRVAKQLEAEAQEHFDKAQELRDEANSMEGEDENNKPEPNVYARNNSVLT